MYPYIIQLKYWLLFVLGYWVLCSQSGEGLQLLFVLPTNISLRCCVCCHIIFICFQGKRMNKVKYFRGHDNNNTGRPLHVMETKHSELFWLNFDN